ncbi:MAG: hypothetical protein EOP06_30985, partial [Proteobacteria bacterium]
MRPQLNLKTLWSLKLRALAGICLALSITSAAQADTLKYLARGDQSLMQMADLIKSARHSIDLSYYIIDPCSDSTNILFDLLREKSRSGVKVRVIVDAFTHKGDLQRAFRETLEKDGIDLRYFNRKRISASINYRMHAKIMLADGQRYISGGRNIADDYFGLNKDNFIDRDVYVEGASAAQAQNEFDSFWSKNEVFIPKNATGTDPEFFNNLCKEAVSKKAALLNAMTRESKKTLSAMPSMQCSNVKFTYDDPEFWYANHDPQIDTTMNSSIASLESELQKKATTRELVQFLT